MSTYYLKQLRSLSPIADVPASMWACGTTRVAASNSFADVQTEVTAAQAGDCIQIPAGAPVVWNSTLVITKALKIIGAGEANTVITRSGGNYAFEFNPASPATDPAFRLTAMTINGGNNSGVHLTNSSHAVKLTSVRVDHCTIKNCRSYGIRVEGEVRALVDHVTFEDNYLGMQILGNESDSWNNFPLVPGTADYVYIEDCAFTFSGTGNGDGSGFCIESGQGGRYVVRYCTVTENATMPGYTEIFDIHGNQGNWPTDRGSLGVEIYNNTYGLRNSNHRFVGLRGGDAKIFNNAWTTTGGQADFELTEYDGWAYQAEPAGLQAYPGHDPVQNAFYWANTLNGSNKTPTLENTSAPFNDTLFIQLDRDYFLPASGTFASRPGSGTYYGCTDTGALYHWNGSAWDLVYAPYTYPHPKAA